MSAESPASPEEPTQPSPATPDSKSRMGIQQILLGILYYTGLCFFPLTLGGVLYLAVFETAGPHPVDDESDLLFAVFLFVVTCFLVILPGLPLFLRSPKRMLFGTIWCWILVVAILFLGEWVLRFTTPPWPTVGLHAVPVEVARDAWAFQDAGPVALNDWGQRDSQRSVTKPPGTFRIAMIGDSFLEESTTTPLSQAVESQLGRSDVEVLNLGVSATEPDEYFYRVKNIALALDIDHCVLCLFAGNDFIDPNRTLETTAGILAVYPRGSLFSSLGLHSWNHLLTNHQRPVLKTWLKAGNLLEHETHLGQAIAGSNDQQLRDLLFSIDHAQRDPVQLNTLAQRLNSPEMPAFFQMIRHPDKGRFRSYYLHYGLWSASVGDGQWEPLSERFAYHWVKETVKACEARNVGITLVIIPEAFQVDPRMVEQWKPLTDMRQLLSTCRTVAEQAVERAQSDGIATIDLQESFEGVPGTYLNLDGHWSDKGLDLAAEVIAARLLQTVVPPSP